MKKYFHFIKIEHTLFSLPLIYAGVFLAAETIPQVQLLVLVLVAATGARTIAMTLNRIIDAEIDRRNLRTNNREIPAGRMSLSEAAGVLFVGAVLYFGAAYFISWFCFILSPIPLIIFVVYPYSKRFTALAHFGVGLGLSMAPLGGWFAVKGSLENIFPGALISLFTLLWATGFDVIYSTLDEKFDKEAGLFSFPSRFGSKKALIISSALHILAFGTLILLFLVSINNLWALPFLLLSGILLYLEQKKSSDVELAFFKINAVIGFVVLAMVLMKGISL
ncbi:MAG: UbiA-like polyprenyltransferase [Bacteroidota bacterium]|nr:UbiA-like polyprenyltransferase [Bacteroidota bacterium]